MGISREIEMAVLRFIQPNHQVDASQMTQRLRELKKIDKVLGFAVQIQKAIHDQGKLLFKGYSCGNSGEVQDRRVTPYCLFYNDEKCTATTSEAASTSSSVCTASPQSSLSKALIPTSRPAPKNSMSSSGSTKASASGNTTSNSASLPAPATTFSRNTPVLNASPKRSSTRPRQKGQIDPRHPPQRPRRRPPLLPRIGR